MQSIVYSIVCFAVAFFCGVMCIRKRLLSGNSIGILAYTLFVGGVVDYCGLYWMTRIPMPSFPLTAALLYVLLSVVAVVVSMTPLLGDESPSSKILLLVMRKGSASAADLESLFSETGLVDKRIEDMVEAGWIKKQGNGLRMLPLGEAVARIVSGYRSLLGWRDTG